MALWWIKFKGPKGVQNELIDADSFDQAEAIAAAYCAKHSRLHIPGTSRPAIVATKAILDEGPESLAAAATDAPVGPLKPTRTRTTDAGASA